jgi:biopolymer transport protein ExbD
MIEHRKMRRKTPRVGLNLTPMIDVVFQLLIYFLLATNFALGEQVFRMDLPERGGSSIMNDPFDMPEEPLRIRVLSTIPDRETLSVSLPPQYPRPSDLEGLERFLRENRSGLVVGLFLEDHPIQIVPAPDTRWEHVVDVFNAVIRAGYRSIHFSDPES